MGMEHSHLALVAVAVRETIHGKVKHTEHLRISLSQHESEQKFIKKLLADASQIQF